MADRGAAAARSSEAAGERRFLTFRVAERRYALPAEDVSEIILIPAAARLPHSPKCLMGLANLRGTVLPLVDLRAILELGVFAPTDVARAIVLTGAAPVALAVDTVDALVVLKADQVETRQAELAAEPGEHLRGAFQAGPRSGGPESGGPESGGPEPGGPEPGGPEPGVAKILDLPFMLAAAFGSRSTPRSKPRAAGPLVAPGAAMAVAEDQRLLISFTVAGQEYALPLESVREIVRYPDTISGVPRAEAVLLGVTAYRDSLLPLLSLRGLLGFAMSPVSDGNKKVIVTLVGGVPIGLVADQARAIIRANVSQIESAPPMLAARTGGESRITAIYRGDGGRRLVSVLAPEHLFREDVMRRSGDPPAAPSGAQPGGDIIPFVVFRLGREEFALPVSAVDEVARVPDQITRVPKTPEFLEGVINLRGEVLPVIDQRRRFDMPKFDGGDLRRLIVVRSERHRAGLIVDSVSEVLRSPAGAIGPPPELAHDGARLIDGVINEPATGRMILVLDPSELLTRAEHGVLDKLDLTDTQTTGQTGL